MTDPTDPAAIAAADWPSRVLDEGTVGYAVVASGGLPLVWRNAAFDRHAAESGLTPEQLAEQLVQRGAPALPLKARGQEDEGLHLLELVPEGVSNPGSLRDVVDSVTGVRSREAVLAVLAEWCASRHQPPFALVFLDLDDFKSVNDRQGHLEGDRCLRDVGDRLRALVRAGDVVGRYGGDEFLILLQGVSNAEIFQPVQQRLLEAFAVGAGGPSAIEASFGVAYSGDGCNDPHQLIRTADRAMYAAKRAKLATE